MLRGVLKTGTLFSVGSLAAGCFSAYYDSINSSEFSRHAQTGYVSQSSVDDGQGLSSSDIAYWNSASIGSRLIPLVWLRSLEGAETESLFLHSEAFENAGYIARSSSSAELPIGFAIDRQSDSKFVFTKLRWYGAQSGNPAKAEPWVGWTCSGCHTSTLDYQGHREIILGGSSTGNLQGLVDDLLKAARVTLKTPAKWDRFSRRVLASRYSVENDNMLRKAVADWIVRIETTTQPDGRSVDHGHGRTDAFGHIANSVIQFAKADAADMSKLGAPVSYPHLWNAHRQNRLQWNGAAVNTNVAFNKDAKIDIGALARNASSAIGTFGEIVVPDGAQPHTPGIGFKSSLNISNLKKLESLLPKIKTPKWPTFLPPVNVTLALEGQGLFKRHCASCHSSDQANGSSPGVERMVRLAVLEPRHVTDPTMACNAVEHAMKVGKFKGVKEYYLFGRDIGETENFSLLLKTVMASALVRKTPKLMSAVPSFVSGALGGHDQDDDLEALLSFERESVCGPNGSINAAYKARPLEGIWATAPYLHNGSVPTLYDMLLPASKRPRSFWVGPGEFDPVKVGLEESQLNTNRLTLFQTHDAAGLPVQGNSNVGHEFGVDLFSERDRLALVEYLKSL